MKLRLGLLRGIDPVRTAAAFLASRVAGVHRPVLVNIEPTHRCNLRCRFCDKAAAPGPDMGTAEALGLLGELCHAGTISVCFDGGEPLLHPGITEMCAFARKRGMRVALSTNGTLIAERKDVLRHVDVVKISIDGSAETHDEGRGAGAHARAMQGARVARSAGAAVTLRMTLARHNVSGWRDVLEAAKGLKVGVLFQPAMGSLMSLAVVCGPESADVEAYRVSMEGIVNAWRCGEPVANEAACLEDLTMWPSAAPVAHCAGGRVQVAIGPEGGIYPCGRVGRQASSPNVFELGLEEAFQRVARPSACHDCWCTLTRGNCLAYGLDARLLGSRLGAWAPVLGWAVREADT